MCLELKSNAKLMTAMKDMVVYKAVNKTKIKSSNLVNDGDTFDGDIKGEKCSGKIHKTKFGELYFCTNNPQLDGKDSPEKFGFRYSWVLSCLVESIIVNDKEVIGSEIRVDVLCTPYQRVFIEIGETYTSELIITSNGVNDGLHSFLNLKSAIKIFRNDSDCLFVKCIIPSGSHYYKGVYNGFVSYASDTLKYVEVVEKV